MKKKDGKKRPCYHWLMIVCLIAAVTISAGDLAERYAAGKRLDEEHRRLASLAQQTTEAALESDAESVAELESEAVAEPEGPYRSPINFEELLAVNPDTVGWIRIPGTEIDYPIVQTDNNDTYLHTDFYGRESVEGAIYLDYESQKDMIGKNTILYGHNMKNGSMFRDLVRYKDEGYLKEHQYFTIYTPERMIQLKAVACYYAKSEPVVRTTRFRTDKSFQAFVQAMLEPCGFAEIPEQPVEALYTFVTCSYEVEDARTLLYAVEAEFMEPDCQKEADMLY